MSKNNQVKNPTVIDATPNIIGASKPRILGVDDEALKQKKLLRAQKEREEDDKAILKSYIEWLGDNSYLEDYDMYQLLGRDVLIRVFRYVAEDKKPGGKGTKIFHSMDTDRSASAAARDKNVPIAKIIAVGPQVTMFKPGDVITIIDAMGSISENPAHTQWMEAANSKPAIKSSEPARYVDNLIQWAKYMFVANKLTSAEPTDYQTFLVPDTFIRTKIKSDEDYEES